VWRWIEVNEAARKNVYGSSCLTPLYLNAAFKASGSAVQVTWAAGAAQPRANLAVDDKGARHRRRGQEDPTWAPLSAIWICCTQFHHRYRPLISSQIMSEQSPGCPGPIKPSCRGLLELAVTAGVSEVCGDSQPLAPRSRRSPRSGMQWLCGEAPSPGFPNSQSRRTLFAPVHVERDGPCRPERLARAGVGRAPLFIFARPSPTSETATPYLQRSPSSLE
jgi:hypothetical protein